MKTLLYEGKAKIIHEGDDASYLIAEFKDSLTAFNGIKKDSLMGKGVLNCTISAGLFQLLESCGIYTQYLEQIAPNKMKIQKLTMIPIEFVVRNIAAGSLCKRYGIEKGLLLPQPIVELYYKNDDMGDPLINDEHAVSFGLIGDLEMLNKAKDLSLQINDIMIDFFTQAGIKVVDFKLEFGFDSQGHILLGDELSPDNFRFWDLETNEPLDKDRFRNDLGDVLESYQEVLDRINKTSLTKEYGNRQYTAHISIMPRKAVFDPQGEAVKNSLHTMGYQNISDVQVGKLVQIKVTTGNRKQAYDHINTACQQFIANPVIEDYKINIQ